MKKIIKKSLISITAALTMAAMTVGSASASYIGNNIASEKNGLISFSDGELISVHEKTGFSIIYMTDLSEDSLIKEYFGLTDEYSLTSKKSKTNTVYTVNVDDEEKADKLFESAEQLYKDGKIKNAYKSVDIEYSCADYNKDKTLLIGCAVSHYDKIKTYINPDDTDEAYWGDVNNDGKVNARDCAAIASAIAHNAINNLNAPENADFNQDGSVNVRDAASIARELSKI